MRKGALSLQSSPVLGAATQTCETWVLVPSPAWGNSNPHAEEHASYQPELCLLEVSPPPLLLKQSPRHEARTKLSSGLTPFRNTAPTFLPSSPQQGV